MSEVPLYKPHTRTPNSQRTWGPGSLEVSRMYVFLRGDFPNDTFGSFTAHQSVVQETISITTCR